MTSQSRAVSAAALEQLLLSELECAKQLLSLVEREHELLSDGDIDNLQPVVEQKNRQIASLQATSRQREQLQAQSGYDASLAGLELCIASLETPGKANNLLNQLIETAQSCQATNSINGRLVQQRHQFSRNALHILQSQNELPTDTYTQQGTPYTEHGTRTLGKA